MIITIDELRHTYTTELIDTEINFTTTTEFLRHNVE